MGDKNENSIFIGINLDETVVYVIATTEDGATVAESSSHFDLSKHHSPKGCVEQSVESWWQSTCHALGAVTTQLCDLGYPTNAIRGISVSSPPGTFAIINRNGEALYPAIMAQDARAEEQAARLNCIGQEHVRKVGYAFRPTDTISKIVWFKENEPDLYENAFFAHQADYILGRLKGRIDTTDPTLAVTTGFDPSDNYWPDWLDYDMHLSVRERLPRIGQSGQIVGTVSREAAQFTGLPAGLPVILGCSSQTAAFLASGAKIVGDFFTIFGETMQIDGISNSYINYPNQIVKMNRLPNREWFFSTRTNTGTEWIDKWFSKSFADENIEQIDQLLPTKYLAFPNVRRGEIFPFNSNSAEGFISPATDNRQVQFAACIQGTALVERMIYQMIDNITDNLKPGCVYTIGPWCRSDIWMQCRADTTERIVHRLAHARGADFGTALVAAMGTKYSSLEEASNAMVHIEKSFYPNPERTSGFKECYTHFLTTMEEQGYLY